jgi:hypothetical protein
MSAVTRDPHTTKRRKQLVPEKHGQVQALRQGIEITDDASWRNRYQAANQRSLRCCWGRKLRLSFRHGDGLGRNGLCSRCRERDRRGRSGRSTRSHRN